MKKYKVEFVQTGRYIVDVLAVDEQEATDKASVRWEEIKAAGTEHYHQDGDSEVAVGTVYDVTGTDDPFNP